VLDEQIQCFLGIDIVDELTGSAKLGDGKPLDEAAMPKLLKLAGVVPEVATWQTEQLARRDEAVSLDDGDERQTLWGNLFVVESFRLAEEFFPALLLAGIHKGEVNGEELLVVYGFSNLQSKLLATDRTSLVPLAEGPARFGELSGSLTAIFNATH